MDQRVLIELINGPFLKAGGNPAEYEAGLDLAICRDKETLTSVTEA
jgi:hypothetical protein